MVPALCESVSLAAYAPKRSRLTALELAAEEHELGRIAVEPLAFEPLPVESTTEAGW